MRLRRALDTCREVRRGRRLLTFSDVLGGGALRWWDAHRAGLIRLDFFGDPRGVRVLIGGPR